MKHQNSLSAISIIFLFIIPAFLISSTVTAQAEDTDNITIGKIVSVDSEILGEQRNIFVYLPIGYEQSEEKFPVIYVLDGRAKFFFS